MEVNVHRAKTHLAKRIAVAESEEEGVIAPAGKPSGKLVAIAQAEANRPARKDLFGIW